MSVELYKSSTVHKGDTLIEVVISLSILASVLTVATTGAVNAWRASRLAGERTYATAIAQRQADALKAYKRSFSWSNFNPVSSFSMAIDPTNKFWVTAPAGVENNIYNYKITYDPSSTASLKRYDVLVSWQSQVRPQSAPPDVVQLIVDLGENN